MGRRGEGRGEGGEKKRGIKGEVEGGGKERRGEKGTEGEGERF